MSVRGQFDKFLLFDTETSGLAFANDDPSYDILSSTEYQIVSIGLLVVNANDFSIEEEMYREIQFDDKCGWTPQAEKVHGLSKNYLKKNGTSDDVVVCDIADLIIKHWSTTVPVVAAGHNVMFDVAFLKRLMRRYDIEILFSNRIIDTNSVGFATFGTYNSDELFKLIGQADRQAHNALDDAKRTLKVLKTVRKLWDTMVVG